MQENSDYAFTVPVTSDNKYIIFGTSEERIKIWYLQKRHETVLEGHAEVVTNVKLISDDKYIVSCSIDRLWEYEIV